MKRSLIVHFHLYKNAGSTIDKNLQLFFKDRWASFDGIDPNAPLKFKDLLNFAKKNSRLLAISSHQVRPQISIKSIDVFPIVFIRHPIDRLKSVYNYEIIKGIIKKNNYPSFANYCEKLLVEKTAYSLIARNSQTTFLSQANFTMHAEDLITHGISRENANEAIQFLLRCPVVGIVNRMEKSIDKILKIIPKALHFVWFGVADNAYRNYQEPLKIKLNKIKNDIGVTNYNLLNDQNKYDIELFNLFYNKLLSK